MQLKSCKKTYNLETQRAAPLEETLARIEPKVAAAHERAPLDVRQGANRQRRGVDPPVRVGGVGTARLAVTRRGRDSGR